MVKDNIPCIYLFIYKVFKSKSNGRIFISYERVREILRRRLHKIPRNLHYEVLKEMEKMNLIKRIGNTKNIRYELVGKDVDKLINQLNFPI